MMYRPGDEYRYPQYAKRGLRWECCILNKYVGFGYTRKQAHRNAVKQQTLHAGQR